MPIGIAILIFFLFIVSVVLWLGGTALPSIVRPIFRKDVSRRRVFKVFGIATAVLFVLFIVAMLNADIEPQNTPATSKQDETTNTAVEENLDSDNEKSADSVTEQEAIVPSTLEEKMKSLVASELKGQNNNNQDYLRRVAVTPTETNDAFMVRVEFNADDNLTSNMKKRGIEIQMAELYQKLYTSNLPINRVAIQAYTMLVDQYGNQQDTRVYETYLNKDEAGKINWSVDDATLRVQIIPGVWTVSYVHAVYRE